MNDETRAKRAAATAAKRAARAENLARERADRERVAEFQAAQAATAAEWIAAHPEAAPRRPVPGGRARKAAARAAGLVYLFAQLDKAKAGPG